MLHLWWSDCKKNVVEIMSNDLWISKWKNIQWRTRKEFLVGKEWNRPLLLKQPGYIETKTQLVVEVSTKISCSRSYGGQTYSQSSTLNSFRTGAYGLVLSSSTTSILTSTSSISGCKSLTKTAWSSSIIG